MSSTVQCPECGATLPLPAGFTGPSVRCGRCRHVLPVPAAGPAAPPPEPVTPPPVVTAKPLPPVVTARPLPPVVTAQPLPPVVAAPPILDALPVESRSPRRAARGDEPGESRPASRRPHRPRGGGSGDWAAPRAALMAGGIGLAGLLLIGCCGGGLYYFSSGSGEGGGLMDDVFASAGWERMTVPGSGLSVEMPTLPPGTMPVHFNPFDLNGITGGLYSERHGPDGLLRFMAGPALGGGPRDPLSVEKIVQGARAAGSESRVVREFRLRGQVAAVIVFRQMSQFDVPGQKADTVVLFVQNPTSGVTSFGVSGQGIDEHHPDVQRFFDSVRVTR